MTPCVDYYQICVNLAFREKVCEVLLFSSLLSHSKAQTDLGK